MTRKILITGGTGWVGGYCVRSVLDAGAIPVVLSRDPVGAKWKLGKLSESVQVVGWGDIPSDISGVVHLAGEPVFGLHWTDAKKNKILQSRVEGTQKLCHALRESAARPEFVICASAIGYYGDRGAEELTEESPPGTGFLAEVCLLWEKESIALAETLGARGVIFRIGVVLGSDGGALPKMMLPFRLGLGGRVGSGDQWMSWIHIRDLAAMIAAAISDSRWRGVYNAVAPRPVTNAEWTRVLSRELSRPAPFPVPERLLRLGLGEMSELVLASQKVSSARAVANGFQFQFPVISQAVKESVR